MKRTLNSTALSLAISLLTALVATPAWARSITVYGSGTETGYCSSQQGYFCIQNIKSNAEASAKRQAQWSCTSQMGRPSYSGFCNSNCSPSMLPPNGSTWVRCSADCSMQCELN